MSLRRASPAQGQMAGMAVTMTALESIFEPLPTVARAYSTSCAP